MFHAKGTSVARVIASKRTIIMSLEAITKIFVKLNFRGLREIRENSEIILPRHFPIYVRYCTISLLLR